MMFHYRSGGEESATEKDILMRDLYDWYQDQLTIAQEQRDMKDKKKDEELAAGKLIRENALSGMGKLKQLK